MRCLKCHREPINAATFCNHCGPQLQVRCNNCNALSPMGSSFCHSCGTELSAQSSRSTGSEATPSSKRAEVIGRMPTLPTDQRTRVAVLLRVRDFLLKVRKRRGPPSSWAKRAWKPSSARGSGFDWWPT